MSQNPNDLQGGTRPYANLIAAGAMLRGYGTFLKVIGILAAIVGVGVLMYGCSRSGYNNQVLIMMSGLACLFGGLGFHVSGTFLAAAGEAGHALADIAVATSKTSDEAKVTLRPAPPPPPPPSDGRVSATEGVAQRAGGIAAKPFAENAVPGERQVVGGLVVPKPPAEDATRPCPKCGKPIQVAATTCGHCWAKLA